MDYRPEKTEKSDTFVIRIGSSAGEGWSGSITWVTGKSVQKFSSMQEMLQLMETAVSGSSAQREKSKP